MKRGDVLILDGKYLLVGDVNELGGLNNEESIEYNYAIVGNIFDDYSLLNKLKKPE